MNRSPSKEYFTVVAVVSCLPGVDQSFAWPIADWMRHGNSDEKNAP
jgi:hypothetical protein